MKAILLAGGKGTRMRPLTHTSNKHTIPIANKPLIFHSFEMIVNSGIKDIGIVINDNEQNIPQLFEKLDKKDIKITFIREDPNGGVADAISHCKNFIKKSKFIVVLADNILGSGIAGFVKQFKNEAESDAYVLGINIPIKNHYRFGMATFDDDLNLIRYIEKPGVIDKSKLYNPQKSLAIPGIYFFDERIFQCLQGKDKIKPSIRGEREVADIYNWLLKNNYKVKLKPAGGWYKDPGNPDDALLTNQMLLMRMYNSLIEGDVDENTKISGNVKVGKGSEIKNSIIRGPVTIGNNCKIENAYIGPFTSIYHHSEIIDVEIENSIILGNVVIQDVKKRIDASIIGWNSKVGKMQGHQTCLNLLIGDDSKVFV